MSNSIKHHYIPKGILREFCFHNRQSLWYFDKSKPEKNVHRRNIDSVFFNHHLNSFLLPDGSRDESLETFYSAEFDNHLPKFIEILSGWLPYLNNEGKRCFSPDEYRCFIQFFYNHMLRSPDAHGKIVDEVLRDPETSIEYGNQQDKDYIRVNGLAPQSRRVLEALQSCTLHLATPASGKKQFVVGSNPVFRFSHSDHASLERGKVEVWTTLTPKLAVGFIRECGTDIPFVSRLKDSWVNQWNKYLVSQSSSFAGASKELISSLSRS